MNLIKALPEEKLLIQLAEECAEASQAALKLVRALNGDTPVGEPECRTHLLEELADVRVCSAALMDEMDQVACDWIAQQKIHRWEKRLCEKSS